MGAELTRAEMSWGRDVLEPSWFGAELTVSRAKHTTLWYARNAVCWQRLLGAYSDILLPVRDERLQPVEGSAVDAEVT